MSSEQELPALLTSLQNTLKLQSALMAKFEQREVRMQASFDQRMQALQGEVAQVHRRVDGIVGGASSQIAKEAKDAVAPVAAQYDRDVSATSAQLQKANKTVWMWFAAAGAILLLVLLVGWTVLGYYRRELAAVKDELCRYENAIPVLQAYYASDAAICGGRVCVNVDPNGQRAGDKRQYRQAKPRSQK
ncbi:hypothetical protein LPY95_15510 [Xanthomonas citri pv. malvacearum]|uniref:hypothetical protein n=1 Tax=Xanthomonas citri TaxID=346 RepID=UPI0022B00671|nr:hypothetical protein [Xanthomonas citri]WAW90092.1 hypothetical protein LPY95_15510 [Xanthomonas citri pv. malvacearum]WAW94267.1 hypothetical protein LGM68_15980 [Xanthomonas citri pv. malvacearum]